MQILGVMLLALMTFRLGLVFGVNIQAIKDARDRCLPPFFVMWFQLLRFDWSDYLSENNEPDCRRVPR